MAMAFCYISSRLTPSPSPDNFQVGAHTAQTFSAVLTAHAQPRVDADQDGINITSKRMQRQTISPPSSSALFSPQPALFGILALEESSSIYPVALPDTWYQSTGLCFPGG
jgi:hypothetical protein